jgi:hypothetical protein
MGWFCVSVLSLLSPLAHSLTLLSLCVLLILTAVILFFTSLSSLMPLCVVISYVGFRKRLVSTVGRVKLM